MINSDVVFCMHIRIRDILKWYEKIQKNVQEVLWMECKFFLDYFVYLMCFLICVHIIAGERGVYKDVSENS